MFSIVFYSKTIGKQKKLSEWVNPERSRAEIWYKAFSYSVDSNCKRFLETYFVFLNLITRAPTEVVDLTEFFRIRFIAWDAVTIKTQMLLFLKNSIEIF